MAIATTSRPRRGLTALAALGAFVRRDFLVAVSYRFAMVSDVASLTTQLVLFGLIGRLVDTSTLPRYGGAEVSYVAYVAVGVAVTAFLEMGLTRMAQRLRAEQLQGTLETLFIERVSPLTLQLSVVAYDLAYVPIRTAVFLLAVSLGFDVPFGLGDLLPVAAVVLAFVPWVWGLGVAASALVLTFRRGAGPASFVAMVLGVGSGAYFPLDLLPAVVRLPMQHSPVAVALEATRDILLGGAHWARAAEAVAYLLPSAVVAIFLGRWLFGWALARERRLGTLGSY